MSDKRRALPPWMSKEDVGLKEKQPRKTTKKEAARAILYCMNEKEMVEAAVACLGHQNVVLRSGQQIESKMEDAAGKKYRKMTSSLKRVKPATEAIEEACENVSYVSETDLDISEMDTLPYATDNQEQKADCEDLVSPAAVACLRKNGLQTEKEHLTNNHDKDDAMRLVREIFFSR
ncbi:uncharacterized protein si:ch211-127m7.2 [Entelurus aequoreus]|uniref:uncharacterized protein si:ch211-127m7.2 n=1 Tax=Entelurus aequoreus TaxID=161455 RepID=UPI002B1E7745|nr:uncharacterized protein si:ch211-127m7.2 [Entelurus aequoreus]